jgi:hypothetical protein
VEEIPDEDDMPFFDATSVLGSVPDNASVLAPRDESQLDSDNEDDVDEEMVNAHNVNCLPASSAPPPASTSVPLETCLPDGKLHEAPSVSVASAALKDLCELLWPHRKSVFGSAPR